VQDEVAAVGAQDLVVDLDPDAVRLEMKNKKLFNFPKECWQIDILIKSSGPFLSVPIE
jgi:hypothetical protein